MTSYDDATSRIIEYPAKHLRVLGPPGSGKTGLVIERYRALTGGGAKVFILTYSREQLKRITGDVLAPGTAHAGMSPVLTYFTLAREILDASRRPVPRIIEGMEELLLVRQLVHKHAKKFTSDYKNIRDSERFQRDLLGLFHLLLQNHIKEDRLAKLKAAVTSARLADVLALYELYLSGLSDGDRATFYDLSWRACDRVASLPDTHPFRKAGVWLVDDFQDIDAGQFALLTALLPRDGAAVNVFGDPMGSFFGFRGTHARYLMREFPERYPCETMPLTGVCLKPGPLADAIETLTGEILGDEAKDYLPLRPLHQAQSSTPAQKPLQSPGPLFDPPSGSSTGGVDSTVAEVQLEVTEDEVDEAYTAAARVHELIAAERYRPHEIAVVANDKHRYEPLLRAAFEQRGLPLDTGRPPQGAFGGFVRSLFVLLEDPRDPVAMEALTTSPFYPHFRSECIKDIDADGGGAQGRAGIERDAVRKYLDSTAPELRSKKPHERMTYVVQRSLMPACRAHHEATGDESVYALLSVLLQAWEKYAAALEVTHGPATLAQFMYVSDLFATSSQTAMPSVDEVGFYSCREMKGRSFPAVIVLGCSELLFPSVMKRDGLLPAAALEDLCHRAVPELDMEVYGARSPEDHLTEEYHLLVLALTRARQTLYLSAPRMFAGQARPAPAAILKQAWPEADYRLTPVSEINPPQVRFAKIWTGGGASTKLSDPLGGLNRLGPLWNLPAADPPSFALEPSRTSQGTLKRFAKCPRLFFYEKVLHFPQEDNAALTVGSLFHKIMAMLADKFSSKKQLHAGTNDALVREMIGDLLNEKGIRGGTLFDTTLRFYLLEMVRSALREDLDESEDYSIVLHEELVPFDYEGRSFHGQMDRIEKSAAGFAVLDYKTGDVKKTGKTIRGYILSTPNNPDRDDWQAPMYVMASREKTGAWPHAFRYMAQRPGEDPFFITLYVVSDDGQLPPEAESNAAAHKRFSFLRHDDIHGLMRRAVEQVDSIFSTRTRFERTTDTRRCRSCNFKRLCDRNV